jgi:hypothetical protein
MRVESMPADTPQQIATAAALPGFSRVTPIMPVFSRFAATSAVRRLSLASAILYWQRKVVSGPWVASRRIQRPAPYCARSKFSLLMV